MLRRTIIEPAKNVIEAAKKYFANLFGKRVHTITHTASDTHPDRKQPIYLFVPTTDQPNEKAEELILGEDGMSVKLGHLRKHVFLAASHTVSPGIMEAVKVKIDPSVNHLRLGECDKFSETITVTIPKSSAVAPADIYFLADNTGRMTRAITNVQSGASAMLTALQGLGYRDIGVALQTR